MEAIAGTVIGLLFGSGLAVAVGRFGTTAARVERKLDLLLRHSGIDLSRVADAEAATLYRAGKKIEAIKAYRELTGCGLAEAKTKVESLA